MGVPLWDCLYNSKAYSLVCRMPQNAKNPIEDNGSIKVTDILKVNMAAVVGIGERLLLFSFYAAMWTRLLLTATALIH